MQRTSGKPRCQTGMASAQSRGVPFLRDAPMPIRPCLVILSAVAALVLVEARPVAQQAREDAVCVGILRSDALFLPIAVNDGQYWWNAWPFSYENDESVQALPLPVSLDAIPDNWLPPSIRLPREWRVQMVRG